YRGDRSLGERDLPSSAGDAVRSRGVPPNFPGTARRALFLMPPTLVPPRTPEACPVGLQSEAASSTRACPDVRHRAVPGTAPDRPDDAFLRSLRIPLRRVFVIVRIVPILHPLSCVSRQVFDTVGRVPGG